MLVKIPSTKFHENSFGGSQAVPFGQTYRQSGRRFFFFVTALGTRLKEGRLKLFDPDIDPD